MTSSDHSQQSWTRNIYKVQKLQNEDSMGCRQKVCWGSNCHFSLGSETTGSQTHRLPKRRPGGGDRGGHVDVGNRFVSRKTKK